MFVLNILVRVSIVHVDHLSHSAVFSCQLLVAAHISQELSGSTRSRDTKNQQSIHRPAHAWSSLSGESRRACFFSSPAIGVLSHEG